MASYPHTLIPSYPHALGPRGTPSAWSTDPPVYCPVLFLEVPPSPAELPFSTTKNLWFSFRHSRSVMFVYFSVFETRLRSSQQRSMIDGVTDELHCPLMNYIVCREFCSNGSGGESGKIMSCVIKCHFFIHLSGFLQCQYTLGAMAKMILLIKRRPFLLFYVKSSVAASDWSAWSSQGQALRFFVFPPVSDCSAGVLFFFPSSS